MQEYTYKGNIEMTVMAWAFILGGNLFLGAIVFLVLSYGGNTKGLVVVFAFGLVWNVFFFYHLRNSPFLLTLTARDLSVSWNRAHVKTYSWNDVQLKTIGLNPVPVILIRDRDWCIASHVIPRIVVLNGWRKAYRDLVRHIELTKQQTTRHGDAG